MCPTALGRKEKKLSNVHIVQWGLGGVKNNSQLFYSSSRKQPSLKASRQKPFSSLSSAPFRGDVAYFAQLENTLARQMLYEWWLTFILKRTQSGFFRASLKGEMFGIAAY